ncbi:hypothetical protein KJ865_17375, partial [Myxococcota bacterium]|nr:hypothetical protein [Myxococcota bacterium]
MSKRPRLRISILILFMFIGSPGVSAQSAGGKLVRKRDPAGTIANQTSAQGVAQRKAAIDRWRGYWRGRVAGLPRRSSGPRPGKVSAVACG